jgi:hypothetical protein
MNDLAARGAGKETAIDESRRAILRAPMPSLFPVHELLHGSELGLGYQWIFDYAGSDNLFRFAGDFPPIGLPTVDARIAAGARQISFLVDHAPARPDCVSQDQMHAAGGHAHGSRMCGVILVSCQELTKNLANLSGFRLVKEFSSLVADSKRKHDLALSELSALALFFLG